MPTQGGTTEFTTGTPKAYAVSPAAAGALRTDSPGAWLSSKAAVTVVSRVPAPPAAAVASGVTTVITESETTVAESPSSAAAAPPSVGSKVTPVRERPGSSKPLPVMVMVEPPFRGPAGRGH